jgi:hypothetical protein
VNYTGVNDSIRSGSSEINFVFAKLKASVREGAPYIQGRLLVVMIPSHNAIHESCPIWCERFSTLE